MDEIYENADYTYSTTTSDIKSLQRKGNSAHKQKREREVTSSKRTKVCLIVLSVSLVFALGGVCTLLILYVSKLAAFDLLNSQHIIVSKQLTDQENNRTIMERKLHDLTVLSNNVGERLDVTKTELHELTVRYNNLREWIDAQSCNFSAGGWTACGGKLYFFSSDEQNWSMSRDVCVSKGADLVTITSQTEQDFLVSKIKETHWIGLNDLDTEGHWIWVNNQTLDETGIEFWFKRESGKNEPDNWIKDDPSGEDCASLGDSNGNINTWFDGSCKYQKRFICEKKY